MKDEKYTELKKLRLQEIAKMFRKGMSKLSISEKIQKDWNIKGAAAAIWIRETYKYMNSDDTAFIKNLRRVQLERLEYLLEKTVEQGDYKTANSICDTINKTFALYEIKTKVEITDNVIKFKFADEIIENQPYKKINSEYNNDDDINYNNALALASFSSSSSDDEDDEGVDDDDEYDEYGDLKEE